MIQHKTINCITYGLGDFDHESFKPVQNDWIKPKGGLWASPIESEYGWKHFCEENEWNLDGLRTSFEFTFKGLCVVIDSFEDLRDLYWIEKPLRINMVDFERLQREGIQGVLLTTCGLGNTKFTDPNLYGWDCESLLVMDRTCIK